MSRERELLRECHRILADYIVDDESNVIAPLLERVSAILSRPEAEPSQHEASMAAVERHKGAVPETDALKEKFDQYYRDYDDTNHEQEVWDLAEMLERHRDELRAELEALRKQLKPDDLSRWKEAVVDKHKGEYYYKCNVCGVSDWIASYGTYDQLKCKCNT